MSLLAHNEQTLNDVECFVNRGEDCCVVNPCGSGKTSVMAAFLRNHPNASYVIITKQRNAAAYYRQKASVFSGDNVHIVTYNKMFNDFKSGKTSSYNVDFFLVDEAHYVGASKWKEAFTSIVSMYKPRLIGITATPQRYEQLRTAHNVVSDFFGGNTAGNFTSKQLEEQGVFVEPEYVLSVCDMQKCVDERIDKVIDSDITAAQKEKYCNKLREILQDWQKTSKPEVVFREYLPKFMYKSACNRILVYVSNVSDLEAKKTVVDAMVRDIFPDKTIRSYTYTYKSPNSALDGFLKEDQTFIKVLFSIDKIMETVHIDDLRIAIMLRPSVSKRIITQQFGRLNSIKNREKPLIIDMVDNLSNLAMPTDGTNLAKRSGSEKEVGSIETEGVVAFSMPHIKKYAAVFSEIDKATSLCKFITYGEFTGSMRDLCTVFDRNYNRVKALSENYTIEECIKMTPMQKVNISQKVFDDLDDTPEFMLTNEQKEYAINNAHIIESFLKNRNVNNEDVRQELYVKYLYHVWKTDGVYSSLWTRNQRIASSLRNNYIAIMRRRMRRASCYANPAPAEDDAYEMPDLFEHMSQISLRESCHQALSSLTPREQEVLLMFFGFYGEEMTLTQIGKLHHVSGESIRQIREHALRKLRHPSRVKLLRGYLS